MATVIVPDSLARLFDGMPRRIEADAGTAGALIAAIDCRFAGFRDRVCETSGGIRRHILIFIDGAPAGLDAEIGPSSELLIVPALSGG
jgi:hypothetical protein